MSALNDLVAQIEDANLRERIAKEVERLSKQKKFGLVFEEHLPECSPLYDIPVKVGAQVARKSERVNDIYRVLGIKDGMAECLHRESKDTVSIAVSDLVVIAEFGEPIYPYLKPLDSVCNAPDSSLWHTLIEADNYHALQLLEYLYAGKVDCIYIDPPYNTGARDWKYNNDYVDGSDSYRHSKWISFMQKRLKIAKKLLNPRDSVLIVTIDEKEYLHLGCLLEELFPEARMQMITSVISAKGVVRNGQFSRVEEYIFIIELGSSHLTQCEYNMLDAKIKKASNRSIEWLGFRRRAPQAKRESRPNQFYPVFIDKASGQIHSIGEIVKHGVDRNSVPVPEGCAAIWPLSKDGDERLWSLIQENAVANWKKGYLRANWNKEKEVGTVYYLAEGTIKDIENGTATVIGYNGDGSIIAMYYVVGTTPPKRVWNVSSHNAEIYGTNLLSSFLGDRFSYPKSLYAVHDVLRFYVANKPNALILDFFAGSGTTLHAVNLLNARDGGKRKCVLVTNNEVSADEAKSLQAHGVNPGDEEWDALGVARYVTWPRTVCSIKGVNISGEPLKGNYLDCDFPLSNGFTANAAFFKLGFLDKTAVALGQQFREMLPTLWMKAGARGKCPEITSSEIPYFLVLPENNFAVLVDERYYMEFVEELDKNPEIETIFIVTDSDAGYRDMIVGLEDKYTYQLYRDYLDNFRINSVRR